MTWETRQIYEFGPFRLDAAERVLLRDGRPVSLSPKAFGVLQLLVESSGHIVEKDELMDRVWADTFVEEGNLKVTVSVLRKALEEGAGESQYIETVPRRGYRFIGAVKEVSGERAELFVQERATTSVTIEEVEETEEPEPSKGLTSAVYRKNKVSVLVAIACVVVVGLAVGIGVYSWATRPASGAELKSIAVLPFRPLVEESRDESLEVGMADTLITSLSNLRPLIIRPTSAVRRYGGLDQDPVAAGRELQVDAVLDGSIQRLGDRIRVTVRLIRVRDGSSLWAKQFDETITDIFAVQDSISRDVAGAMAVSLRSEERGRLTKHHTDNAEAYQLYVKGRYLWNKRTEEALWKSIEYFNQAIKIDPNYALAYAGLADAYAVLPSHGKTTQTETLPKARAAALKALDLDNQLPEAHTALATLSSDDWHWAEAEKQFKHALELNPNYPTAHQWYGEYLRHVGRLDEALQEYKRAQELDPTSIMIQTNVGQTLYLMRRNDEAIEHLQESLEMESDFVDAHWILGLAYTQKAMHEESRSEFEKALKLSNGATNVLALLGVAYAKSGNQSAAQDIVEKLKALIRQKRAQPHDLAILYTGLGEKDLAFEWLGKAYEDRSYLILCLKTDPFFDPLRSDPRFSDLLKRAGLSQ